jgi:hypothetical protein
MCVCVWCELSYRGLIWSFSYYKSYWLYVPQHASDIHFILWEWAIMLSPRWRTTTLPQRHQELPRRNPTKSVDRTKVEFPPLSPDYPPSTFTCGSPWRMWYTGDVTGRNWNVLWCYPSGDLDHGCSCNSPPNSEVSTSWRWALWTLVVDQHASQPSLFCVY